MKKITVLLMAVLMIATLFAGCSDSSTGGKKSDLSGIVETGGSTSVNKVMEKLIAQFENDNDKVTIKRAETGSGDGISKVKDGTYEIGHSSRELKKDGSEDGLKEIPYAIDGIAVVINKDNGVENLTKQQIFDIYTGKIANWKDVGGKDELIAVVTREDGSGTRTGFAEIIGLEKKKDDKIDPDTAIKPDANTQQSTGAIQTTVSGNRAAIGYMSFSDVDTSKVKMVNYEGVKITTETLKDGSYKLMRNFYMITKDGRELSAVAQAFVDFALSSEGQQIVKSINLLPIK